MVAKTSSLNFYCLAERFHRRNGRICGKKWLISLFVYTYHWMMEITSYIARHISYSIAMGSIGIAIQFLLYSKRQVGTVDWQQ